MNSFTSFVASEGFAIAFGVFVCIGLWKSLKFLGTRLFGEEGILPGYVRSVQETHQALKESHQNMAESNQQTSAAVVAMQKCMEREAGKRSEIDQRIIEALTAITNGAACRAQETFFQLQSQEDASNVKSKSKS